jgi:hypothetical protein
MITKLLVIGIIEKSTDYINFILNLEHFCNIFNNLLDIRIILFNISNIHFEDTLDIEIININYNSLKIYINKYLIKNLEYQFCYFVNPNCFIYKNDLIQIFNDIINYNLITFKKEYKMINKLIIDIDIVPKSNIVPLFSKNIFRPFFFKIETIVNLCIINNLNHYTFLNNFMSELNNRKYICKEIPNSSIFFNLNNQVKKPIKTCNIKFCDNNGILLMKDFGLWGLGNQIFQYSFMFIIQKITNKKIHFLNKLLHLNKIFNFYKTQSIPLLENIDNYYTYHENDFSFNTSFKEDIMNITHKNINFNGFFQSYKYLIDFRNDIIDHLVLNYIQENKINNLFLEYTSSYNRITSLHIRRGDYKNYPDLHFILSLQYYIEAIKKVNTDFYLIFSDEPEWCLKNIIPILNKPYKISYNEEIVDLFLMSKCHNNIIANSSFSWWGAYLNTNIDKKVIAPKKWFSNKGPKKHDLHMPDWILIDS